MAAPVQHLFVPRLEKLHGILEKWNHTSRNVLQKELDRTFDWLLGNFTKFLPPSQSSKEIIISKQSLLIEDGRELKIDQTLKSATLQMSELLALDEVQTHIILKRWKTQTRSDRTEPLPMDKDNQVVMDTDLMGQVLRVHIDTRNYLARCLAVLLESCQDESATILHVFVKRLLDAGLEKKLFTVLRTNLEGWALPGHRLTPHSPQSGALAVAKSIKSMPIFMLEAYRDQLSEETRELQGLLMMLYGKWQVSCTAEQLVELTQLLRRYVFQPSIISAAAGTATSKLGMKCMANALLLAAMRLDQLLGLLQSGSRLTPDVLPLAARTRDLDAELRNWHVSVEAVPVLLTWSAVVQLLGWSSRTDAGSEEDQFQRDAFEAGGFDAWASTIKHDVFEPAEHYGISAREVMLSALNVVNTAYNLSALTLDAGLLNSVLGLISIIMEGCPDLCDKFWDESDPCGAPMRQMLQDCTQIFPAFYPYLVRMLVAVSTSQVGATRADQHLRNMTFMAWLHPKSDPVIQEQQGVVQLQEWLVWSGAPDVPYINLPKETLGDVQPLPELASHLQGSHWLVCWSVRCPFGLGYLLLAARALQCVISIRADMNKNDIPDPELLEDLHLTCQLLCNIARHNPEGPFQLAAVYLNHLGESYDLTQLCADAISSLIQRGRRVEPKALPIVANCLTLIQGLMEEELGEAMHALAGIPLLVAPSIEPMPALMLGQLAEVESVVPGCLGMEMTLLQAVQSEVEMSQQEYPVTLAFLSLLHRVLIKGCVTGPVSCWVLYALHGVLGGYQKWPFKLQRARWQVVASALRVLHTAVFANARFPGPTAARGRVALDTEDTGVVQVTHLAATIVQQLCFHGVGYFSHLVQVLLEVVPASRHLGFGDLEATNSAAEALLELVPVLLCAATQFPTTTPLEHFWFTPVDKAGSTPVRMLSTYIVHPAITERPSSRVAVLALQALHAVAVVAKVRGAALLPAGLSASTLLPLFCNERQAGSALRKALMRPFDKSHALSGCSEMLTVAVDLLEVALEGHPALVEALLFPSPVTKDATTALKLLQGAEAAGPYSAGSQPLGGAAALGSTTDANKAAAPSPSTLEAIWGLLEGAKQLWHEHPNVLADVLRAVFVLWRNGIIAGAAVNMLRSKPDFWECMGGVLEAAEQSDVEAREPEAARRIQCEMYILQLVTMELYACPRPDSANRSMVTPEAAAFWQLMDAWPSARLGQLLPRYREKLEVPAEWVIQLLCQLQRVCLDAARYSMHCAKVNDKHTDLKLIAEDLDQECQEVVHMVNHMLSRNEAKPGDLKAASLALLSSDELTTSPRGTMPYTAHGNPVLAAVPGMKLGTALLQLIMAGSIGFSSRRYDSQYLMASSKLKVMGRHMSEHMDKLVQWVEILNGAVANSDAGCDAVATLCTLMSLLPRDKTLASSMHQEVLSSASSMPSTLDCIARELNRSLVHFVHTLTDPRMELARVPWGLYTLRINLLDAIHQLARSLLQLVRVWRDAIVSPSTAAVTPGSAAASWSSVCIVVVGLLKLWLRDAEGLQGVGQDADANNPMSQVTVCLLGAVLLSLPPPQLLASSRMNSDVARMLLREREAVQHVLLDVLPDLCVLCRCCGENPLFGLSTQLLARCLQVGMAGEKWMPRLRAQLDLDGLKRELGMCLAGMMSRQEEDRGNAGDALQGVTSNGLGPMQLLMVIASIPDGPVMLQDARVLQFASTLAQRLLAPDGGMLAAFVEQKPDTDSVMKDRGQADYAGAYFIGSKSWSWTHQLWCSLLGLVGCLMKELQGSVQQLENSWMAFLLVVEPRLLLACQPPAADCHQPLTRASVLELERSLLLLLQLTPCQGAWLYHLPTSLMQFRTAVTSFVCFVAHHGAPKAGSLVCPPCSRQEEKEVGVLAVLPAVAGLYQACTRGSAPPVHMPGFGSQLLSLPAPSSSTPRCSEYSAQLARGMYTCVLYALMFLYATSPPQTQPLNSVAWPPTATLLALLDQVVAVIDSLIEPGQVTDKAGRRTAACVSLLRIAQLLPELLAASGHALDRSTNDRVLERVHKLERLCNLDS